MKIVLFQFIYFFHSIDLIENMNLVNAVVYANFTKETIVPQNVWWWWLLISGKYLLRIESTQFLLLNSPMAGILLDGKLDRLMILLGTLQFENIIKVHLLLIVF